MQVQVPSTIGYNRCGAEAHRAVLKHAVKDGAVGLANGAQVEAPHLHHVLILVVRRDVLQERHIICTPAR